MDKITPIAPPVSLDKEGEKRQEFFYAVERRIRDRSPGVLVVVDDGYESAVKVDGEYFVHEMYHGNGKRQYDSYRPASSFECHLLGKIEGLNSFFVE